MAAEYHVDYRWFLERQAEPLDDLAVNDYSAFVGLIPNLPRAVVHCVRR